MALEARYGPLPKGEKEEIEYMLVKKKKKN